VPFALQARQLRALDQRLSLLDSALRARNDDDAWEQIRDVLAWLYRMEEAAREEVAGYYTDRALTAAGQTLAALIWVRGLVEHRQAEVKAAIWKPASVFVMTAEGLKRTRPRRRLRGGWSDATPRVAVVGWPRRSTLPAGLPERHGRDQYYDAHVAERPLMEPLRVAREFAASL
jgi:hypothetical protein